MQVLFAMVAAALVGWLVTRSDQAQSGQVESQPADQPSFPAFQPLSFDDAPEPESAVSTFAALLNEVDETDQAEIPAGEKALPVQPTQPVKRVDARAPDPRFTAAHQEQRDGLADYYDARGIAHNIR